MVGWDFSGANLAGASFDRAIVEDCNFANANFSRAQFSGNFSTNGAFDMNEPRSLSSSISDGPSDERSSFLLRSTSNDFDHSGLIQAAGRVRIIMNDGFNFFRKYQNSFEIRASSKRQTEICLLAEEGPHIETIARRSEKTPNHQQADIQRSADLIKQIFGSSSVALYGMKTFFPYCLFQYDDTIILSFYFAYLREQELPMLILHRTTNPNHTFFAFEKNTDKLFRAAEIDDGTLFMNL
jgi:hypothetical protein